MGKNFNRIITLVEWDEIWKTNIRIVKSISLKGNIIKLFYRWHYAPIKLAQIYKNSSGKCWKCKKEVGTYIHCWPCEKVKGF